MIEKIFAYKKSQLNNRGSCYINKTGVVLHTIKNGLGGKVMMQDNTLWRVIGDFDFNCAVGTEVIVKESVEKNVLKVVIF